MAALPRWFTSKRFENRGRIFASILAFGALLVFAGYTFLDAMYLTSTCFGDNGQLVCPAKGPGWVRPLPGLAAIVGMLLGLVGLFCGRPIRALALTAGFLLTAAGLISSKVMNVGGASTFL